MKKNVIRTSLFALTLGLVSALGATKDANAMELIICPGGIRVLCADHWWESFGTGITSCDDYSIPTSCSVGQV
jgi:hypothetical protein